MTIQKLASKLAKSEDGRSQAKVGDIRQLLKILAQEIQKNPTEVMECLCKYSRSVKPRAEQEAEVATNPAP
jgi:hypothetical protein